MNDYNNMSFGELWKIFSEKYGEAMEQEMDQIVPIKKNTLSARAELIRNLIRTKYFHRFQLEMGMEPIPFQRFPLMIMDYPVDVDDMTLEDYQKILYFREWGKFERMEYILCNPWMRKKIQIFVKDDKMYYSYYSKCGPEIRNIEKKESTFAVEAFGKRFQEITEKWVTQVRLYGTVIPDNTEWIVKYKARYTSFKNEGIVEDYPDNWGEFLELINSVTEGNIFFS